MTKNLSANFEKGKTPEYSAPSVLLLLYNSAYGVLNKLYF